jgi:hypothetical protein
VTGLLPPCRPLCECDCPVEGKSQTDTRKAPDHPNMIKLFQVMETVGHTCLMMEHTGGGELMHCRLATCSGRPESTQIGHRCHALLPQERHPADLTMDNHLLDAGANIKVSNFGLGGSWLSCVAHLHFVPQNSSGTKTMAAPR